MTRSVATTRWWLSIVITLAWLFSASGACGGSTPAAPSAANPTVTIQATYSCSPSCSNDRDNYALSIDCVQSSCAARVSADNPLLNPNTLTWTGQLAPGPHTVEVRIGRAASVNLSFRRSSDSGNTGGVTPGSIRILPGDTGNVQTRTISRCDVETVAVIPSFNSEWFYGFDVKLGTVAAVC